MAAFASVWGVKARKMPADIPSMLKMKSLAVWTSKAVWSPNSPCSSSTSSDTCDDSWSRAAPDRKSTSDGFLTGAGERGATALISVSISTTLRSEDEIRKYAVGLPACNLRVSISRQPYYHGKHSRYGMNYATLVHQISSCWSLQRASHLCVWCFAHFPLSTCPFGFGSACTLLCAVTLPILTIGFEGLSVDWRTKRRVTFHLLSGSLLFQHANFSVAEPSCFRVCIMLALFSTPSCASWDFVARFWRTIWYWGRANITF